MPDDGSSGDTGPIDDGVLERVARRLDASARFESVLYRPESAPNAVVAKYDTGYFPAGVERAALRIRWFETDDFTVHYSEHYRDGGTWECRWDRHLNDHNTRAHFHPPPAAETPGEDASYAVDWREVIGLVLGDIEERIRAFWE